MVVIAEAGAGNAAGALTFPTTLHEKLHDAVTVAGMQCSFLRHSNNTAYTWELVSSASEATKRGADAGAAAAGGTLQVVVMVLHKCRMLDAETVTHRNGHRVFSGSFFGNHPRYFPS